jgi:hypothetical protein
MGATVLPVTLAAGTPFAAIGARVGRTVFAWMLRSAPYQPALYARAGQKKVHVDTSARRSGPDQVSKQSVRMGVRIHTRVADGTTQH